MATRSARRPTTPVVTKNDLLVLLNTVTPRNQNVNITTAGIKTVRRFHAGIRDVNHLPLNSSCAIRRPAITIVARLK